MITIAQIDQIVATLDAIPSLTALVPWQFWDSAPFDAPDNLYCTIDIIDESVPNIVQKNTTMTFTFVGNKNSTMKQMRDAVSWVTNEIIGSQCMKLVQYWDFQIYNATEWSLNWPWQTNDDRPVYTKNFTFRMIRYND